jgi:hypothetical protein
VRAIALRAKVALGGNANAAGQAAALGGGGGDEGALQSLPDSRLEQILVLVSQRVEV